MQAAIQALYRLPAQDPYRFGRRGYSGPVQAAYTGYVVARTVLPYTSTGYAVAGAV